MNSFGVEVKKTENVQVVLVTGYFSEDAGKRLFSLVSDLLLKKNLSFVIDFTNCNLINSPGVVALMNTTLKIVDDYKGKLCLIGVDDLKLTVFKMAGIFPLADQADSIEEAILKLGSPGNLDK
ncbi:MAG: hypothetical protein HQM10_03130 [Candidatus Riflebacteria bacterium]|nr:hypothetical protein [Candidatus Riflebacteria bacterium]